MVKNRASELTAAFIQACPYVSCERKTIEEAAARVVDFPNDIALDLMRDHILSQDLAEEIEL